MALGSSPTGSKVKPGTTRWLSRMMLFWRSIAATSPRVSCVTNAWITKLSSAVPPGGVTHRS